MSVGRHSVGRALAHDSARKHVTGAARYVDDRPEGQQALHCGIGYSPVAHGLVRSLDLSAVREAPGVVDVITAADVPGQLDIGPVFPGDPLFAAHEVEHHGQPLFAVAALDQRSARQALRRARVEIEELPATLELAEALAREFYVRPPHRMQRGDAKAAIAQAPHRVSGELRVGGQEQFYLEGQVSLALPDEDGGMVVHTSSQNPTEIQKVVAGVLGVSHGAITAVTRRMGGGFGGKETQAAAWACIAALFARRTGKAVKCVLARRDDMVMTGKRHNFLNRYEAGFDDDGRISGVHHRLAAQCGFSPDLSDAIVDRAMFHCDNAYYLPAVTVDGYRCKTHTVSNTAFRGFGGPQGMIAMEALIDEIAMQLGKDPLEVRKTNFYDTKRRNITPYHQVINSFPLPQIVEQLEAECDYWRRREQLRRFNDSSPVLKKGLALTPVKFGISFTVTHLNQGGALVHLYTDGSIHLNHGGTEMGQGLMTKIAQVVAEEFQVGMDKVHVLATSTDKVPNTPATAASAGTDLNGMAARNAARTIKRRLVDFLAEEHGADAATIRFHRGRVRVGGHALPLAEVAERAWRARVAMSATGFYRTPQIHYDRETASGHPFFYFANGAAATEVIVDRLTGEYKVVRTDIIHDAGDSLNPAIDMGQVEGGYIQGLGWLTTEELQWDERGRLSTDGAATYKIPAIGDTPQIFNARLLENSPNAADTIFRSKAVGEPPLMLAISGWCAIRDAIAAIGGYRHFPRLHAPATPEQVLATINAMKRNELD